MPPKHHLDAKPLHSPWYSNLWSKIKAGLGEGLGERLGWLIPGGVLLLIIAAWKSNVASASDLNDAKTQFNAVASQNKQDIEDEFNRKFEIIFNNQKNTTDNINSLSSNLSLASQNINILLENEKRTETTQESFYSELSNLNVKEAVDASQIQNLENKNSKQSSISGNNQSQ